MDVTVDGGVNHCRFFFFNDTATTEIYTLSLHDALPIFGVGGGDEAFGVLDPGAAQLLVLGRVALDQQVAVLLGGADGVDRKSTRLNSSHGYISYAVFCLKKKREHVRRAQRGTQR